MGESMHGYKQHREGFAHLRCPNCNRKVSNRAPIGESEPAGTVLIVSLCPNCCERMGAIDPGERYYSADGIELEDTHVHE